MQCIFAKFAKYSYNNCHIMDLELIKSRLEVCECMAQGMGMELVSTSDEDSCKAVMTVDGRNCQPFGFLSGGASLAMAETLAGCGSYVLCPDAVACVGQNVQGNHVHPASVGEIVTAVARIVYKGKTSHVWQVEICNADGELISFVTVTNRIIRK